MNVWLAGAAVLLAGVFPCGWIAVRASRMEAVVALQLASTLVALALVLLAQGYNRSVYYVVGLTLAAISFVGTLLLLRLMEREL